MEEQQNINRLESDQFNADYQIEIEKRIANERHDKEIEKIYQENPELLVPTTMLYIPMKINGKDVQAFIDTGAQSTIMSKDFAEDLGLLKNVDTRYRGKAVGVGSCTILGKIHALEIYIKDDVKFTVSIQI